jgi:putative hydrolase of the HAD superfamily
VSFNHFKVLTFDVVGTSIDFETGVLQTLRSIGGKTEAELGDDAIWEAYHRARAIHDQRSSEVYADLYRTIAGELDLPNTDAAAMAFQQSVLRWPAFPDSVDALRRLRQRFRLVAMTNADRTAFSAYERTLARPFHDSVTFDETGLSKPDPGFFHFNRGRQSAHGFKQDEILHVAQSQFHDMGVARALGYTICWIERRQGKPGWGGTPTPATVTKPDFHFATLAALADAVEAAG